MKVSLFSLSAAFLAVGTASAQSMSDSVTATITVTPGCPSATPADVIVTRSAVVVPICSAGNDTKASIVSMSGYGANMTMPAATGSVTGSAGAPEFTGAAKRNTAAGAIIVLGGAIAALAM